MGKVSEIVDRSLENGVMTQKEHDDLIKLIHKDGRIDGEESTQLSRLFAAVREGTLKIVDVTVAEEDATSSRKLADEKRRAIERDETRELQQVLDEQARLEPQPQRPGQGASTQDAGKPGHNGSAAAPGAGSAPPEPPQFGPSMGGQGSSDAQAIGAGGLAATMSVSDCSYSTLGARAQSKSSGGPIFRLRSDRMLEVNLSGRVWIRTGSMVAYYGAMKFTREGIFEHGVGKVLKRAVTGEGTLLTKATGQGNLFLADQGKKISIIGLHGESLMVSGTSLLAFEETVEWDITFLKQLAATWTGGFFQVRLAGKGFAAVTTHYDPIILRVTRSEPLMTDASATVAWSGGLVPQFRTDISMSTLIGRASGETVQMAFQGDGFVIIQPFEEGLPAGTSGEEDKK